MVYPLIFSTFRRVYRSFYYTMFTIQGAGPSRDELQELLNCIRARDAAGGHKCLTDYWRHVFRDYYQEGQEYQKRAVISLMDGPKPSDKPALNKER